MWEKRLNENYFKLFRKKRERMKRWSKRSRKQERENCVKKEGSKCHPPRSPWQRAQQCCQFDFGKPTGGSLKENSVNKGKRLRQTNATSSLWKRIFLELEASYYSYFFFSVSIQINCNLKGTAKQAREREGERRARWTER